MFKLIVRSGDWKLLMNSNGTDLQLHDIVKDKKETTNLAAGEPQMPVSLGTKCWLCGKRT